MNNKNSAIILCKDINLDREYINVLTYTESEMLSLCQSKAVASAANYTFIRQDSNEIKVDFSYATCLQCNYIAFQNPNYSNKWFFAFIDEVSFISDNATRIRFTVDEHSTWYDYWDVKSCYVLREHVADDTIGLHTVPENFERGDYIINSAGIVSNKLRNPASVICLGVSYVPANTLWQTDDKTYGGIFSGLTLVIFDQVESASKFIRAYDRMGRGDAITTAYMIPYDFVASLPSSAWQNASYQDITNIRFALLPSSLAPKRLENDITLSINTTIDSYTPKNNKMFVFPYNYLSISNNSGTEMDFHYEDFINNTPIFDLYALETPNIPTILIPNNYKNYVNTVSYEIFYNYGIQGGKFPSCSWQTDLYTNWMTQNGVNILGHQIDAPRAQAIGGSIEALLGAAGISDINPKTGDTTLSSSGVGGISSGLGKMLGAVQESYRHSLQSPAINGQVTIGDLAFSMDQLGFTYYRMSIKQEYAKIIDDFWSRYGYQINRIKLPNMISRVYWNYIQIGSQEEIGYSNSLGSVPAKSMDVINKIYRRGVTMWHNHDNIGNYSLNNTIVTP